MKLICGVGRVGLIACFSVATFTGCFSASDDGGSSSAPDGGRASGGSSSSSSGGKSSGEGAAQSGDASKDAGHDASSGGGGGGGSGDGGTGGAGAGGAATGGGGRSDEPHPDAGIDAGGPRCGDGKQDPGEECDDGNTRDGDGCSSICTSRCELCEGTATWGAGKLCSDLKKGCYELAGQASAGPALGLNKSELCADVMACVRRTGCSTIAYAGSGGVEACYCGAGVDISVCLSGTPAGPCKDDIEAGAESVSPTDVGARFLDVSYAAGAALKLVARCDQKACLSRCDPSAKADAGP
jgi:cysteine-rich repeat protein